MNLIRNNSLTSMICYANIILAVVTPCAADLNEALAPLKKPDIRSAKVTLKKLEVYSITLSGREKKTVDVLSKSIKSIFTSDYKVQKAFEFQRKEEAEARKHDKTAADWLEGTKMKPKGNPQHARSHVIKAEKIRSHATAVVDGAQLTLQADMKNIDALISGYFDDWQAESCLILSRVVQAINKRSLPDDPFQPTISEESIEDLRMFVAKVDRFLEEAKEAETALNYDKAFRLYTKARQPKGRKRCAAKLAVKLEEEELYGSACEYYEIAGDFIRAANIRKEHPDMLKNSFAKLNSAELYAKMAPSCVRVRRTTAKGAGHGSGFFIKRGGYILTNRHVIENSVELEVVTMQGDTYNAKVLASSKTIDLAVIKIELKEHDVAKLGVAEFVKIGTRAYIMGYPENDLPTATWNEGSISNTNRAINKIPHYQIDISANKGNSGGPVMLSTGQVIGVTTLNYGGPRLEGFNFAIQIDAIRSFLSKEMGKDFAEK